MRAAPLAVAARRLGTACVTPVLIAFLILRGPALRAQRALPDDDLLRYLNQTVTWYRDVNAVLQSPEGSRERLLAGDLRDSSAQALRSAFAFARTQAAIPVANARGTAPAAGRGRNLAQAAAAADQRAEQAQAEIEQLNRQLQTASPRARPGLTALRDEVMAELNFAKARRDALRNLIGFLSVPGEGGLAARISDLERTVPEAAAARQKSSGEPVANASGAEQEFHPESAGLIGLTTRIFSVSRKTSRLNRLVEETEALRQANQTLRVPLRSALQEVIRRADAVAQRPESADPAALNAQRQELDALSTQFKQVSGSSAPLSEQSAQINATRGLMTEWRRALDEDFSSALRYLLLRAGMLAVVLALIFGFSELWRRATMRYVQDLRRRRQFLLLRRIVVGCTIGLFLILSFVTEFGSLATFAGFSAAGIAVAMQSVILSVVAYFFLVGRWGVRVGDRVTVSGVTGEVVDVGLFRLYLMELGGPELTLEPTGRIVVFPNSIFFQPSAVFKQAPGIDYTWRTLTLKVAGAADPAGVENRLRSAVEPIYAEYRESIEKQHRTAQSSLNLHTPAPRLESRTRFVDSGLEVTIRYPVEIVRAREIDDRISRNVLQEADREPRLTVMDSSAPKPAAKAG